MGNEANRQRTRLGIIRPGPQGRATAAAAAEVKRAYLAEQSRLRMQKYRERVGTRDRNIEILRHSGEGSVESSGMGERQSTLKSAKLAMSIMAELQDCPTATCKSTVLEKLLNHNGIWPMLPEYYPRSSEAKTIHSFLQSYRQELQAVKGAHSKTFLARKGVLLDAAVSDVSSSMRGLSRVLQVCSY